MSGNAITIDTKPVRVTVTLQSDGLRVVVWFKAGNQVTPYAKVVPDRAAARQFIAQTMKAQGA